MEPRPTFYDIPFTLPGSAWSPNTWKTRQYSFNYKGIPLQDHRAGVRGDKADQCAAPTRNKPDGRPHYMLPMIHDPSTGAVVSESNKITEYLDKAYPDTPRLLPAWTAAFQRVFEDGVAAARHAPAIRASCVPRQFEPS
ncbi:hypothetical protein C8J57DRAFT_1060832 [Mycena rebaudengoi]|nr:hypothetical protein C8J57DRAFT_1060832 [Mycena rebaudengoi]